MRMRLLTGLGLFLLGSIATTVNAAEAAPAADAPPGVYSWTGVYVGANFGWGQNNDRGSEYCVDNLGVLNGAGCQVPPPGVTTHASGSGAVGGGQVGYNVQQGQTVLGVETDLQASGISGTTTVNGPFPFAGIPGVLAVPPGLFTARDKINWFGTVRVRVGYVPGERTLFYITGGPAYGHVTATSLFTAPNVGTVYQGRVSTTKAGWTVGGGIEYAVDANVSAKLEALYEDLGHITVLGNEVPLLFLPSGYQHNKNFINSGTIIRVGLNYRF